MLFSAYNVHRGVPRRLLVTGRSAVMMIMRAPIMNVRVPVMVMRMDVGMPAVVRHGAST
jgi:hypothetical protein